METVNSFFTIIIPTYNSEKTISVALESIESQLYKNYSVIIQDGLSQDHTIDIVNEFKRRGMNIKINVDKDDGIYDAMNKAIKSALDSYIIFLGSDDFLYNNKVLLKVASRVAQNKTDVIYGNVYSKRFNGIYDGQFTVKKLMIKNICHQAIFLNKQVFSKIGDFNLKYKIHADYDHNIRWFCNTSISKQYVNLVISNYADGGYSSLNEDTLFQKDKVAIFKEHFEFKEFTKYYFRRALIIVKQYLSSKK